MFRVLVFFAGLLALAGSASADHAIEPTDGGSAASPESVAAAAGIIYLGGNRLVAPFTLKYRDGQIVVNGLSIARPATASRETPPTRHSKHRFLNSLDTLANRLHAAGLPDSQVIDSLHARCAADSAVARSHVTVRATLGILFKDGVFIVERLPWRGTTVSHQEQRGQDLLRLKRTLDPGGLVVINEHGIRFLAPRGRVEEAEAAIALLRSGAPEPSESPHPFYHTQDMRTEFLDPVPLQSTP